MNKFMMISALALLSLTANAGLSNSCKQDLDKVLASKIEIEKGIKSGEITEATTAFVLDINNSAAKITALTCAGLEVIKLEKSFKGRLGLISQEKAAQLSQQVYDEAMAYYLNSSNQGEL